MLSKWARCSMPAADFRNATAFASSRLDVSLSVGSAGSKTSSNAYFYKPLDRRTSSARSSHSVKLVAVSTGNRPVFSESPERMSDILNRFDVNLF